MPSARRTIHKIHLIYPDTRRFTSNLSTHKFPGLATAHAGLPLLAEVLHRKGYTVRVFDEKICPPQEEILYDCDLLGISIQTITAYQGFRLAQQARRLKVPVVFGGVHATLNPEEVLRHGDYVVRNEGEQTLPELIEALEQGESLDKIMGLSYWEDGKIKHNPPRPLLQKLDSLPWPDMRWIEGFQHPFMTPLNFLIYFTQATRGCPFDCNFCSIVRTFGRGMRARSPENVVEELKERMLPSQEVLFFHDDSLAGDKEYLKELLATMIRKRVHLRGGWHSQMRADVVRDKDVVRLMRESRCLAATFGFESINPETLRYMRKGQTPKLIRECIKTMHENDIFVIGFFVFGSDYDDVQTIRRTCRFAVEAGVDFAGFMPLTPFPGTPFHQEMAQQGRIFSDDWELYDVEHVVFWPKKMTPLELYLETLRCYRDFYTPMIRFSRTMKIARRVPSLFGLLMNLAWPLLKRANYQRELFANRDYILALQRLQEGKLKKFPRLSDKNLPYYDLLTGRTMRPAARAVAERFFQKSQGMIRRLGLPTAYDLDAVEARVRTLERTVHFPIE